MTRIWGIVPAAGVGSRIQPLAFSKELLPVGSRIDSGREQPRAVGEYLVERMVNAGATRICFVISPGKTDMMQYFGGRIGQAAICYAVQSSPSGLCDALFTALPFISADDEVLIGLPDTIWFPVNGFIQLPPERFSFLLFPVSRPELFDAVRCAADGSVLEVQVKDPRPTSHWVWGAFRLPGRTLLALHELADALLQLHHIPVHRVGRCRSEQSAARRTRKHGNSKINHPLATHGVPPCS